MPASGRERATRRVAVALSLAVLVIASSLSFAGEKLPPPTGYKAYQLFLLGHLAALNNDHRSATEFYRQALAIEAGAPPIFEALAQEYLEQNQLAEAAAILVRGLKVAPDNISLLLLYGKTLAAQGQLNESETALSRALALDPKKEDSYLALFQLHLGRQDLAAAETVLRQLVEKIPSSYRGHYYLGRVYVEKGDYAPAVESYRQSVNLAPGWVYGWYALGLVLDHLGRRDEALEAMNRVLDLDPDNPQILATIGFLELSLGHLEAAEGAFLRLYQKTGDPQHLLRAGLIRLQGKDPQRARQIFQEIEAQNPSDRGIHFYYSLVSEQEGDRLGTVFHLQQIPPDSDVYLEARLKMAQVLETAGQRQEAIRSLEEALTAQPDSEGLYSLLATLQDNAGQTAAAETTLKQGLGKVANRENLLYQLGLLYERTGRPDEGVAQMRLILAVNPKNASALNFIGYSLAERNKDLEEAEKLVLAALGLRPGDGFITDSLGWIYFKRGRIELARRTLQEALHRNPEEPVIMEHLGSVYLELGRRLLVQAQQHLSGKSGQRAAIQRKLLPGYLHRERLAAIPQLNTLTTMVEKELAAQPNDPRLEEKLGENYLRLAQAYYEKALDISKTLSQKEKGEAQSENRDTWQRLNRRLAELYGESVAAASVSQ